MTREEIVLDFGASFVGLVICFYHRRLSRWMWASMLSLLAALYLSGNRLCMVTGLSDFNEQDYGYPLYFEDIFWALCWTLFITSLSLVFSDVKQQLQAVSLEAKLAAFDELPPRSQKNASEVEATEIQSKIG